MNQKRAKSNSMNKSPYIMFRGKGKLQKDTYSTKQYTQI